MITRKTLVVMTTMVTLAWAGQSVSGGYCLANRGKEYVVFQNKAQAFSLKLEGLSGPAKAKWFNPFTGEYRDAGTLANGTAQLTPPETWGAGPVALHVTAGPRYPGAGWHPANVNEAQLLQNDVEVQAVFSLFCADRSKLIRRLQRRALRDSRLDDANLEVIND